ncbi:MAG: hypothetical protein LQ342_005659 [Letrouitia transgressa]|nr:MAG: hypothetical protein LQ342_005659 [Letrouitia transgressa]
MASDEPLYRSLLRDTTAYLAYLVLISALGPFQFGFHLAELNTPQDVLTCEKRTVQETSAASSLPQCIQMSKSQFSVVTSIYTLGGLLGAISAGPCCNRYGRLLTMRLTTLTFVIGPAIESSASNIGLLCLGRFISGIGAGAAIVVVPIYISEIAPSKGKGLFGAFTQIMINTGILTAQVLGYFLSHGSLWRIILAVAGGIGVLQAVALLFVPESPKWLAEHSSPQRARDILRRIRGHKADLDAEVKAWNVDSSPDDIGLFIYPASHGTRLTQRAAEEESLLRAPSNTHPARTPKAATASVSIIGAFLHPSYRPAVIAVVAVMVAQQFTGINSIVMYSVSLLSPILPTAAALLIVVVGAINFVVTILCAPLSDKIGRKPSILLSIAGMGTCSVALAVSLYFGVKTLGAVATLLFVASFAVGLGPVPFILANELVGPEAVGATQSWALAANWIATFLVSQFFPIVDEALGKQGKVYYIFAAFALVLGAFIAYWVPETKGKSGAEEVWGRKEARERVE